MPAIQFGLCAVLMALSAVGGTASRDAMEVLNRRCIRFTPEDFIDLVKRGDAENVQVFLQAGMDPNTGLETGKPALFIAVQKGLREMAKVLVDGGAMVNYKGPKGWTALQFACMLGYRDIAEILLGKGADPNTQNDLGVTALHLAVQERDLPFVETLVKHGADVHLKSRCGANALIIALETEQPVIITFFEKSGYAGEMKALRQKIRMELAGQAKEEQQRELERRRKLRQEMSAATGKNL